MCCLFGLVDPNHFFSGKMRSKIVRVLSIAAEERGTDATGIAYNAAGQLHVFKRPLAAHLLRFRIPESTSVVMGHTRMTTQGSEKKNQNNHPFLGHVRSGAYALAHNGVLWNDCQLREERKLPQTKIQTDSYIAVQLIDRAGSLDFASLKAMAEAVAGSFTFTVLDEKNRLFIVKGDSPLCLYHWPKAGIYLYASTKAILQAALGRLCLPLGKPEVIPLDCGEILCIDACGRRSTGSFDMFYPLMRHSLYAPPYCFDDVSNYQTSYLHELKSVAACYGIEPEAIDELLRDGWTFDELEEMIYAGEM